MGKMMLRERVQTLEKLFMNLENTPGRKDKEAMISKVRSLDAQLSDDLTYCFEILDGQHKLGYRFYNASAGRVQVYANTNKSLREYLKPLFKPREEGDLSERNIHYVCGHFGQFATFIELLMNREWKLGIGKSQLKTSILTPMLAKKYEKKKLKQDTYFVTEKLDGNRCITHYDGKEWKYTSRSGKPMNVEFDFSWLPNTNVYDGEILSRAQYEGNNSQRAFNKTSGKINSKNGSKKDLVYVIFDIISFEPYSHRRATLDEYSKHAPEDGNVKILPLRFSTSSADSLEQQLGDHLEEVVDRGGEGLMINLGSRPYEHKRTDAIVKVKEVQTMDMMVIDILPGDPGKQFENVVGRLVCYCQDGKNHYECKVGSGLKVKQRKRWANRPNEIIGKIVEVDYFSISQDEKSANTNQYSLRNPRLKRVREDKDTTSIY